MSELKPRMLMAWPLEVPVTPAGTTWHFLGERVAPDLVDRVRFGGGEAPEATLMGDGIWVDALPTTEAHSEFTMQKELNMELEQIVWGQRVRVNVPGLGDHGQVGTIKKVRGTTCYVHLDWDQHVHGLAAFYAADLDRLSDEPAPLQPVPTLEASDLERRAQSHRRA